jgi:hypothetical protein
MESTGMHGKAPPPLVDITKFFALMMCITTSRRGEDTENTAMVD